MCKIHTVSSGSEKSHKIDEDVIFGVARGLWNVVGMVVWLGEKGGEKEGVTVWDRARFLLDYFSFFFCLFFIHSLF